MRTIIHILIVILYFVHTEQPAGAEIGYKNSYLKMRPFYSVTAHCNV